MQTFLINLARRSDRLRSMQAQLSNLKIPFEIVAAVDAQNMPDEVANRHFAASGPLGPIPKGDKCCTLSHMRAWSMFLSSGDSHALILEDDVALDPEGAPLLADLFWLPRSVGLLKIEHYGPESQRVLLDELVDAGRGRQIGRLLSRHTGAAAYILDRETALRLLAWPERWSLPVDHMLFNPNNSPMARLLQPYQLTPAIARQSAAIGGVTDIDAWRAEMRDVGLPYLKRECVRAYYELRLLPSQIASLLRRESELVRVESAGVGR
ncbi:MAG: glycosyltransferase family 25 protein [Rhizomicrobium sp.]